MRGGAGGEGIEGRQADQVGRAELLRVELAHVRPAVEIQEALQIRVQCDQPLPIPSQGVANLRAVVAQPSA